MHAGKTQYTHTTVIERGVREDVRCALLDLGRLAFLSLTVLGLMVGVNHHLTESRTTQRLWLWKAVSTTLPEEEDPPTAGDARLHRERETSSSMHLAFCLLTVAAMELTSSGSDSPVPSTLCCEL